MLWVYGRKKTNNKASKHINKAEKPHYKNNKKDNPNRLMMIHHTNGGFVINPKKFYT